MIIIKRSKLAIGIPVLIFVACILISFSAKYKEYPGKLSVAIILDMLLVAPVLYYLAIRKTSISKSSVLRVCMAGIILAGLIVSKNNSPVLSVIKTWVSPVIELSLIGFLIGKFYRADEGLSKSSTLSFDFLAHCRAILQTVLGNEKVANIIAAEIGVFYYIFSGKEKDFPHKITFTSYRENGIILVLTTFLFLFIIETTGMHFLFQLWSKPGAWILTALSLYTCLQLFAHIRALKLRPTVITGNILLIRNGLMGGDVLIQLDNIESIVKISKPVEGKEIVSMALIKSFEKNNLAIHLKEPIVVIKAFGRRKKAKTILFSMDKARDFITSLENSCRNNIN